MRSIPSYGFSHITTVDMQWLGLGAIAFDRLSLYRIPELARSTALLTLWAMTAFHEWQVAQQVLSH